ncbi:hypothetical protein PRIPAC_72323 [Pristionchus pacificus]|uniref:Uncharacterized protein n=1 Tax=Pristionchus pacificus TaxID=54126 RepID=A0A2A6BFL7_PRIPA|nr:hypothetical protein PRIPAC_72323 [Pristionchus pacificus]|eukprot:PDM64648.1 hypothetical protein PRIPAC_52904 [Pristionchus pacificus]
MRLTLVVLALLTAASAHRNHSEPPATVNYYHPDGFGNNTNPFTAKPSFWEQFYERLFGKSNRTRAARSVNEEEEATESSEEEEAVVYTRTPEGGSRPGNHSNGHVPHGGFVNSTNPFWERFFEKFFGKANNTRAARSVEEEAFATTVTRREGTNRPSGTGRPDGPRSTRSRPHGHGTGGPQPTRGPRGTGRPSGSDRPSGIKQTSHRPTVTAKSP